MTEDTLHGWKDIAAYVGKSVRSAQRWERELGLPTHRIKTPEGQIVYARRSEIDAWRISMDRKPGGRAAMAAAEEPPAEAPPPPAIGPPRPIARQGRATALWLAGAVVVAVTAWGLSQVGSAPVPQALATLQLVGRNLEARDASGRMLWSYGFDSDVTATRHKGFVPVDDSTVAIARRDFDRDGRPDSLVLIRSGSAVSLPGPIGDALMAFSDDGRLLWTVRGERVLACGGEQYSAPWTISGVIVSPDAAAPRVWAAFHHHTWWPSYVAEILADGRQIPRYTQAGWIMSLAAWTTATGTWGVAAGVMNEPGLGSVVQFDLNGEEATLPASDPRFQCSTRSPDVTPARVVLLPNFEVTQALGSAYMAADRVLPIGAELRVELGDSAIVATLDADGRVRDLAASDGYWLRHEHLSLTQVITHPVSSCPELLSPREVRTWTPGAGWQIGTIRLAKR